MVSFNEDEQQQNLSKFNEDMEPQDLAKIIDDEFGEILMLLNERKDALTGLIKDLRLDFLQVEKMLAGIKQKIQNFTSAQDPRIKNSPALTRGHKFFFDHLQLHSGKIIEALDQELKALDVRLKTIVSDKQVKIDTVLQCYRSTV